MNKSLKKYYPTLYVFTLIFYFLFLPKGIYAEEFDDMCGIQSVALAQQHLPPFQPTQGDIKILVFFIRFSDDNFTNSCMSGWPNTDPTNERPSFTDNFIDQDPNTPHTEGSLTHYFDTMSGGNFTLYGDIYPANGEAYVPANPESYYDRNTAFAQGNDSRRGIGLVHEEVLLHFDSVIDYSDYDNWDPDDIDNDNIINEPDGFVDFIFFAYREINRKSTVVGFSGNFTGIATIDWHRDQLLPITLDNNVQIGPGFTGQSYPYNHGSGHTAGAMLNHISTFRELVNVAAHEFGHYWFGTVHYMNVGRFGDYTGGLSGRMGVIKERLGWISPVELNSGNNFTISDAFSTRDYRRITLPDTNKYFLLENRQRISYFESVYNGNCGAPAGLPDTGLLITHVTETGTGIRDFSFQIEPADALFSGSGGSGDTFKPGNAVQFTPWTQPNSDDGSTPTGIAVTNIRQTGNDIKVDIDLNFSSGDITEDSRWAGTVAITGDITVKSGATLTIDPGTTINFDSGTKLTINGTLDVKGLFANPVTFDRSGGSDWGGIVINSSSGSSSSIKFATIINAGTGLDINGASPTITNAKINNCGTGVRIQSGAAPKLTGNTITYNDNNGVYCLSGATPSFGTFPTWGDNVIRRNGDRGVYAAYSCTVFLGQNTTPPSGGRNSIYENYSATGYQISIRYGSSAMAENNWWGSSSPSSSIFQDTWTIDYTPSWPETSDPHSGRPLTGAIHAGTETSPTAGGKEPSEADSLRQQLWQAFILYQKAKYDSAMQISRDIIKLAPSSDEAFSALNVLRISHAASGKTGLESYLSQLIAKHAGEEVAGVARLNLAWYDLGKNNSAGALAQLQQNITSFSNNAIERITLFQKMVVYLLNLGDRQSAEAAFSELQTKYPNDPLVVEARRLLGKSSRQKQQSQQKQLTTLNAAELQRSSTALSSYPNPFNPETRIQYQIPEASLIQLRIYNLMGQEIRTLVQEQQNSGAYSVVWDGKNGSGIQVGSGLYIYRITVQPNSPDSRPFQQNGKMLLVR